MGYLRFGTRGWRARVDHGFDEASVVRIAAALGAVWASRHEGSTILVGYDTRRDSQSLALVAGMVIAAHGMRVVVSQEACPTPALAWAASRDRSCVGAVMVTAGDAPYEYGGILVRQGDGGPMAAAFAAAVDRRIAREPTSERSSVESAQLLATYVDALAHQADTGLIGGRGLGIVVDPMYGAGSRWVADLLRRVGCEVTAIHDEPVPDFRGLHPDAREPWVDECEQAVLGHYADLGLVLDGDCSRCALIDASGSMLSPHDLAPLVLDHLVGQRGRTGRVVATVSSSARIGRQAQRLGCGFTMVPVGFESVYRELQEGDVILATDERGGICVPDHVPERDAPLGSLMLLELLAGTGTRLDELVLDCEGRIGAMEYVSRSLSLDPVGALRLRNLLPGLNPPVVAGERPVSVSHADGLRIEMPDGSWVLLRASRSSAGACACAEAPDARRADALLAWACALAKEGRA